MAQKTVWLQALLDALEAANGRHSQERSKAFGFGRRGGFADICRQVELAMRRTGQVMEEQEWETTKTLMRAIYDRTRQAYDRGYNYYQFPLNAERKPAAIDELINRPEVQQGVEMWSRMLGWESASVVDWSSASVGRSNGERPFPYRRDQYTIRLQGSPWAGLKDRENEQLGRPVLRPAHERYS